MIDKIRPLYDKILVKRIDSDQTTTGGIIIPDTIKEKTQTGKVLAVGEGRLKDDKVIPLKVKENNVVFFGKFSGTPVIDEDHLILKEDDILGIIEE